MPPRFRPQDFLVSPDQFGKNARANFRAPTAADGSEFRQRRAAAHMQHVLSARLRVLMVQQAGSVKDFALAHDLDYQRLAGLLAGRQIMRLEDIAQLSQLTGQEIRLQAAQTAPADSTGRQSR